MEDGLRTDPEFKSQWSTAQSHCLYKAKYCALPMDQFIVSTFSEIILMVLFFKKIFVYIFLSIYTVVRPV